VYVFILPKSYTIIFFVYYKLYFDLTWKQEQW